MTKNKYVDTESPDKFKSSTMLPSIKRVIPEIITLINEILKTEKAFTNFCLLLCKIAINKRVSKTINVIKIGLK